MPPSLSIRTKDSVENRRARGEISCAECRRHKLKCDKNIPCNTCIRKGCQAICPNGTLAPINTTGSGGTDSGTLKARIADMSSRIRQLEDALQISHGSVSSAEHPLLAPDLLQIKNGAILPNPLETSDGNIDSELLDSFGTLSVSTRGTESYFGIPDPLLNHFNTADLNPVYSVPTLPAPICYLSKTFPFTPLYIPAREIQEHIERRLPSYERASAIVEAYLENISWFFRPVDREQIMEELIPMVYKRKTRLSGGDSSAPVPSGNETPIDPHVLALLLIVFAVGAAADLTLPPWNDEAELYYHLARTSLGLKPVFEGSGLHAVQAIALIGAYDLFACRKRDLEGSWKLLSFSLSLAASIGLNRDPVHFKFSPKLVQRRRRVFWELYYVDAWKSSATGRPLTFTPEVIDCEFPDDTDAVRCSESVDSIWRMRYRFTKDLMLEVVTKLGSPRSVKYSEILALDQKIRDYDPDGVFGATSRSPKVQDESIGFLCRVTTNQLATLKDSSLLLLHRPFFTRALIEDPSNPIRTRFGPSFLSTYRSATSLVNITREQFEQTGHYLMRIWPIWAHMLASTVTLGSIATCGTTAALAPQAFVQFNFGYEVLLKAQMHPLVQADLPRLAKLREQALQALEKHGSEVPGHLFSPQSDDSQSVNKIEQGFSAISRFGKTVRRGVAGGFGKFPPRPRDRLLSVSIAEIRASLHTSTWPDPKQAGPSDAPESSRSSRSKEKAKTDRRESHRRSTSDIPSLPVLPSFDAASRGQGSTHSEPHSQEGSPETTQGRVDGEGSRNSPSFMQVDSGPLKDPSSSAQDKDTSIDPVLFTYPGPSLGYDMFNSFVFLQGSQNGSAGSHGSSSSPMCMESGLDPFAGSNMSPPQLSPCMAFSTDFDVSFDMRSTSGNESIASLLPQDMDAWRAILQDSRYYGALDEVPDSEKGTPKLS